MNPCLWEYSYKRLKLAQLLGQLGIFRTLQPRLSAHGAAVCEYVTPLAPVDDLRARRMQSCRVAVSPRYTSVPPVPTPSPVVHLHATSASVSPAALTCVVQRPQVCRQAAWQGAGGRSD